MKVAIFLVASSAASLTFLADSFSTSSSFFEASSLAFFISLFFSLINLAVIFFALAYSFLFFSFLLAASVIFLAYLSSSFYSSVFSAGLAAAGAGAGLKGSDTHTMSLTSTPDADYFVLLSLF